MTPNRLRFALIDLALVLAALASAIAGWATGDGHLVTNGLILLLMAQVRGVRSAEPGAS